MKNTLWAILISLSVHVLAALALVSYFHFAPEPGTLPTLDLSSVDLSFAEQDDETAAVAPSLPSEAHPAPPKPPEMTEPPPVEETRALPPEPSSARLIEPKETRPTMETPTRTEERRREPQPQQSASVAAPAVAPRQARVEAPARPKRTIRPEYPKGARQRGEQGVVVLEIQVSETGTAVEVKVVGSSGFAELDEAAVKAARAAKFTPAKAGGKPVSSVARLPLAFRLK